MTTLVPEKCTNLRAPLLITGETGTGKSYLARKIFNQSEIYKEKFLTVHLATLKEDLIESELFGHKKGAFTGAVENKNGYLYEVGEGTLFLDEIGELSLEAQKKLLYLMEEKKFTPVGGQVALDFKGRIIMATNKNLGQMVKEKLFREDLYYRIKVFHLELRPLRENKEVLIKEIENILASLKKQYHAPYTMLGPEALDYLVNKEWKGNFRELKNALEYAIVLGRKNKIEVCDFPAEVSALEKPEIESLAFLEAFPEDFHAGQELFEKLFLENWLLKNTGKVNETARRLGISKTTLIQKAKKYRINTLKMRADHSDLAA